MVTHAFALEVLSPRTLSWALTRGSLSPQTTNARTRNAPRQGGAKAIARAERVVRRAARRTLRSPARRERDRRKRTSVGSEDRSDSATKSRSGRSKPIRAIRRSGLPLTNSALRRQALSLPRRPKQRLTL